MPKNKFNNSPKNILLKHNRFVKLHGLAFFYRLIFVFLLLLTPYKSYSAESQTENPCSVSENEISYLLEQVKSDNKPMIRSVNDCKKNNRDLFAKIIIANPSYFEFASDLLKDDEMFVGKFVAIHPEILKYVSSRLSGNEFFMFKMAKANPEVLKYASNNLVDNKGFMIKMINVNPKNFVYASERLQDDKEVVMSAIRSNGKMIKYVSDRLQDDKMVVYEAMQSYGFAANFASDGLQKDKQIKSLVKKTNYSFLENFDQFLKENYGGLAVGPNGSRGYYIVNMAKFFPEKQIVYQPYMTKWEGVYKNGVETKDLQLASKSTQRIGWKDALKDYPSLIKEVENIFSTNQVDDNTVDSLNMVSFWVISKKPKVIAFDLYLLRSVDDKYFGPDVANVVSLTAIAREKKNKKWEVNIIESTFDINLKMDIAYKGGHKRYRIWDVYQISPKDKDLKILFKVEDKDGEYFDLFIKQINDRYSSVYKGGGYAIQINPLDNS